MSDLRTERMNQHHKAEDETKGPGKSLQDVCGLSYGKGSGSNANAEIAIPLKPCRDENLALNQHCSERLANRSLARLWQRMRCICVECPSVSPRLELVARPIVKIKKRSHFPRSYGRSTFV